MEAHVRPLVMDEGALSDATRAAAGAPLSIGQGAAAEAAPVPAPVLVCVAGAPISEAEIAREMQHHRDADPHAARAAAVRALVVRELIRLEAERLGISAQDLAEEGETAEEACARVLLEREVEPRAVDEPSCREWFARNAERLRSPDRVRARHILLACAPADAAGRESARLLGEELIAQLRREPGRFEAFAMQHSACPSREDGGDLGWIEPGQTTPEFERQLFRLTPGLPGLTLETRYGHHVVRVDAVERGAMLSYEQAAPRVRAYLETQAQQTAVHDYLSRLAERYPVEGMEMPAQDV
ncbi:MAG: peptidyl-prolyl cis-trans isomerase [Gammaproteobacteria bacterium]|nr:peptidyl-prolyl cis-trans isomerase [Gammaproteobacteria bacterium]